MRATFLHKIISLFALIFISLFLVASSGGIIGKTNKPGSQPGCTCHNTNASTGVVVNINGPSELKVGEVGTYSVSITGGPLVAAGVNIATSSGTLQTISGEGLQLVSSELTHTGPKTPTGGTTTFQFKFTAPNQSGSSILYATGNSVNNLGTNTGDQWNHATNKIITITPTTNINEELTAIKFSLEQNYPNPFNPSTTIQFSIDKELFTTLDIINESGILVDRIVNKFYNPGVHLISYNASHLATGVYFYRIATHSDKLQTPYKTITKKMLFLK